MSASSTAAQRAHRPLLGILFMLLAASLFPVMNGLAKLMSLTYSSEQVVWARTVGHLLFAELPEAFPWRGGAMTTPAGIFVGMSEQSRKQA
jgi:hypothetical protein